MRHASALTLPAAVLLLSACGGSSQPASRPAPATHPSTHAAAPPTSSTPASTASPSTSTTSSAPAASNQATGSSRCVAGELSGSFLGGQAATGHGLLGFALHNASNRTCVAFGYPGVQFLSQAGQALPTIPTHTKLDFFGPLSNHPLAVAPGTSVSFRLGVTHGAAVDGWLHHRIRAPGDPAQRHRDAENRDPERGLRVPDDDCLADAAGRLRLPLICRRRGLEPAQLVVLELASPPIAHQQVEVTEHL